MRILVIIIGSVVGIAGIFSSPWFLMNIGVLLMPAPPLPVIRRGEFPFKLQYELNGEFIVIEDTLVVEFAGVGRGLGSGSFLKWNKYLLSDSSQEDILIFKLHENHRIYHLTGGAQVHMGQISGRLFWYYDEIIVSRDFNNDGTLRHGRTISSQFLYENYGIKIVNFEIAPPIENRFEYNWWSRLRNRVNF